MNIYCPICGTIDKDRSYNRKSISVLVFSCSKCGALLRVTNSSEMIVVAEVAKYDDKNKKKELMPARKEEWI